MGTNGRQTYNHSHFKTRSFYVEQETDSGLRRLPRAQRGNRNCASQGFCAASLHEVSAGGEDNSARTNQWLAFA